MTQNAVYKYNIGDALLADGVSTIEMPEGAQVLSAGLQYSQLNVWALVRVAEEGQEPVMTEQRTFTVRGTGHPISSDVRKLKFVGTAMANDGVYVFHVWEGRL
jgi:hypothetical protein